MSYVDEVFQMVVEKNPAQPEFHQAVKEVLESLRAVSYTHLLRMYGVPEGWGFFPF